jgi:hypothetical protein
MIFVRDNKIIHIDYVLQDCELGCIIGYIFDKKTNILTDIIKNFTWIMRLPCEPVCIYTTDVTYLSVVYENEDLDMYNIERSKVPSFITRYTGNIFCYKIPMSVSIKFYRVGQDLQRVIESAIHIIDCTRYPGFFNDNQRLLASSNTGDPCYIDKNGNYHGDGNAKTIKNYLIVESSSISIVYDGEKVFCCFASQDITQLDIEHIKIYPDFCEILAQDGRYIYTGKMLQKFDDVTPRPNSVFRRYNKKPIN